jgi:DNA adenine methylase
VSEAEMKIGALAPWFGGKRNMAPLIAEELGPHHSYREPFCGSMAVLLSKPRSRAEIANDLHGDLVNLARCVQHPRIGPALYRRLRRVLCAEALFRESLTQIRMPWDGPALEGGDPERAFHYFVASWQGMNGVAGTPSHNTGFCRRFSSLGGDPGTRWAATVRSIPAWRRRLEGVQVLSTDGIALCEKIEDREGTAIYVDPPYLVKGAKYLHDFADADHLRLAEALRRFRRASPPGRALSRLGQADGRGGQVDRQPAEARPAGRDESGRGPAGQRPARRGRRPGIPVRGRLMMRRAGGGAIGPARAGGKGGGGG